MSVLMCGAIYGGKVEPHIRRLMVGRESRFIELIASIGAREEELLRLIDAGHLGRLIKLVILAVSQLQQGQRGFSRQFLGTCLLPGAVLTRAFYCLG